MLLAKLTSKGDHRRDDPLALGRGGRGRGRLARPARGRPGALRRRPLGRSRMGVGGQPAERRRGHQGAAQAMRRRRARRTSRRSIASSSTTTSRPRHGLPARSRPEDERSDRGFSRGTVYWKDGTVRYDHFPLGKLDPDGRKSIYKRPRVYQRRPVAGHAGVHRAKPGLWALADGREAAPVGRGMGIPEPLRPAAAARSLAALCRAVLPGSIEAARILGELPRDRIRGGGRESAAAIPLRRQRRATGNHLRPGRGLAAGAAPRRRDARRQVESSSSSWPTNGRSSPASGIRAIRSRRLISAAICRPVKEIDLTVRNLQANGAVNLPDSAFTLSAMNIPDGTPGLDRRQEPVRGLIRAGGVVREPRPGEGPIPRNIRQEEIERQKDEETIPAGESGGPAQTAPSAGSSGAVTTVVPNQEYLSLLEEYEPAHRAREKAFLEAKPDQGQREAYLALARLDWDYAPRFLEIARKYPRDPVAIDALGWLVANASHPPESQQAADILIRDHLASDEMIPIYRQLAHHAEPRPVVGGRTAPPRRRGEGPDGRGARPGLPEARGPPQVSGRRHPQDARARARAVLQADGTGTVRRPRAGQADRRGSRTR